MRGGRQCAFGGLFVQPLQKEKEILMKKTMCWKGLLALLLMLSLGSTALAEAMNSGFLSFGEEWGYAFTDDMLTAIRSAVQIDPIETEQVTVRSVEAAYDGVQLIVSANLKPKAEDVLLLSLAAEMDEEVGDTGKTYQDLAVEKGMKMLRAYCVPTILEEKNGYFVHQQIEADGSLSIVTGARVETAQQGAPIQFALHVEVHEMDGGAALMDQEVGAITVNPLQPYEEISYRLPAGAQPMETVTLIHTFFGYALQDMDVRLVDADGAPMEAAVAGDQTYYRFDETPTQLHVMVGGTVWMGERQ